MVRAGVFIGVDKTGNLQRLNDAAAGAKRMHDWALRQGMLNLTQAKLITDADGNRVTPDLIYDAIKEIIDGPGTDQLILYFAGHGVNINRNEHWLLTDAPVRANAAVNVSGSVELARYCGIAHVVVISDACRVAPEGIQAQNVRGTDVFPNESAGDRAKPVDQFFACLLGRTAAEISDPAVAAGNFCALYTDVLLQALDGKFGDILEPASAPGDSAYYVKPVKLESCLEREVQRVVLARNLEKRVNQNPDAILTAHSNWVSKVDQAPRATRDGGVGPSPLRLTPPGDLRAVTATLVRSAMEDPSQLNIEVSKLAADSGPGAQNFAGTLEQISAPFGPDHFETECGIKVRGTRIVGCAMQEGTLAVRTPEILSINLAQRASSVVLRFDGGIGTVIPAVAGFLATVTVQEGELVDVAYEPSTNNWRWREFNDKAAEVRALRALAASASHHGRFRLDPSDALGLARKMQYAKGIDPTLGVYAAYAYHDVQEIDRIREMSKYQHDDLGVTFFDLALLSRALFEKSMNRTLEVVPFVPLFSQGWPLLAASRVRLHPALDGIERTLRESVWSLFDSEGTAMLERALSSGEVR